MTTASLEAREIATDGLILMATVGSGVHGLALPGKDDHDEMGVCIEPPTHVIGLKQFEQDVFRTKPEGVRSEAGDTDRVVYSLRKYCRLALTGNPSVLNLVYSPDRVYMSEWGDALIEMRSSFASRRAGKAFLNYAIAQRQRLLGERGQMDVKRPELVEKYGFDTKYAMHMLRLGVQGIEYMETGKLTLPMSGDDREFIYGVRQGEHELQEVLMRASEYEQRLEDLLDTSPLPEQPDYELVNRWLVGTYLNYWEERGWS